MLVIGFVVEVSAPHMQALNV